MKEIVEKLLKEVDQDIKDIMLQKSSVIKDKKYEGGFVHYSYYLNYELLPDPANAIIGWQYMRDYKR